MITPVPVALAKRRSASEERPEAKNADTDVVAKVELPPLAVKSPVTVVVANVEVPTT